MCVWVGGWMFGCVGGYVVVSLCVRCACMHGCGCGCMCGCGYEVCVCVGGCEVCGCEHVRCVWVRVCVYVCVWV